MRASARLVDAESRSFASQAVLREILASLFEVEEALRGHLESVATIGASRLLLRGDTEATCGSTQKAFGGSRGNVCMAMDEEIQFARGSGHQVSDPVDFSFCLLEVRLLGARSRMCLRCVARIWEMPSA